MRRGKRKKKKEIEEKREKKEEGEMVKVEYVTWLKGKKKNTNQLDFFLFLFGKTKQRNKDKHDKCSFENH